MMHHKTIRAFGNVGVGLFCGVMAACAGTDTPPRDQEIEDAISDAYGDGSSTGTTGGSGNNGGSGGSGGNGGSASGNGGSASGNGGSQSGSGGSDVVGGGGSGGGEPTCDGFQILQTSCGAGAGCHGSGSPYSAFADTLDDANDFVDVTSEGAACSSNPGFIFDSENPGNSLVITKLAATSPCGTRMPLTGPGSITDDQIACIAEFIGGL